MFEAYFHLQENPFSLAPNPRFLFRSRQHDEALAHLRYWIENVEGFVLVTGEVGTGKTTALYDMIAQLPTAWSIAVLNHSTLSELELLEEICRRFLIEVPDRYNKPKLLGLIETYLRGCRARGNGALLIIDEAQNLDKRILEEVRLLSNMELHDGKLLQIALVGQPELQEKLESNELRQLRQRIGIKYKLGPLSHQQSTDYIRHRMTVAGGEAARIFPPDSCATVYELTHGIPREINIVCSQALINAFVDEASAVRPQHVRSVVSDFHFQSIVAAGDPEPEPEPGARGLRHAAGPPHVTSGQGWSVAPAQRAPEPAAGPEPAASLEPAAAPEPAAGPEPAAAPESATDGPASTSNKMPSLDAGATGWSPSTPILGVVGGGLAMPQPTAADESDETHERDEAKELRTLVPEQAPAAPAAATSAAGAGAGPERSPASSPQQGWPQPLAGTPRPRRGEQRPWRWGVVGALLLIVPLSVWQAGSIGGWFQAAGLAFWQQEQSISDTPIALPSEIGNGSAASGPGDNGPAPAGSMGDAGVGAVPSGSSPAAGEPAPQTSGRVIESGSADAGSSLSSRGSIPAPVSTQDSGASTRAADSSSPAVDARATSPAPVERPSSSVPPAGRSRTTASGAYFTLHVASFRDVERAETFRTALEAEFGYEVVIVPTRVLGAIWNRIYLGRFGTRDEARSVVATIKRSPRIEAVVIMRRAG